MLGKFKEWLLKRLIKEKLESFDILDMFYNIVDISSEQWYDDNHVTIMASLTETLDRAGKRYSEDKLWHVESGVQPQRERVS